MEARQSRARCMTAPPHSALMRGHLSPLCCHAPSRPGSSWLLSCAEGSGCQSPGSTAGRKIALNLMCYKAIASRCGTTPAFLRRKKTAHCALALGVCYSTVTTDPSSTEYFCRRLFLYVAPQPGQCWATWSTIAYCPLLSTAANLLKTGLRHVSPIHYMSLDLRFSTAVPLSKAFKSLACVLPTSPTRQD
jgi:hypothetical protein